MPARSVCLVALSLSEAGPGRFGRQVSVIDIYHTIPYHDTLIYKNLQKRRLWGSFVDRQGKRPGLIESGGFPGQFRKKMSIISATADILRAKA